MSDATPRTRQMPALFLLAVVVLCGTTFWGYLALDDARAAAEAAAIDAAATRRSADRILALRGTMPGTTQPSDADLDPHARIVRAVEAVGAESGAEQLPGLKNDPGTINPQAARRTQGSSFEERPTQVQFRSITLEQFVTFLCAASGGTPALRVTEVRLTGSQQQGAFDRWSAEATLSYLAASAAEASPRGSTSDARRAGVQ